MPDYSIHKASDLAQDERLVVEKWLGRSVANDETISVNAYRPHFPPADDAREKLRRDLIAQAREIGSRAQGVTDDEVDEMVKEAFDDIRSKRG